MNLKKRFLKTVHILFILFCFIQLIPNKLDGDLYSLYATGLVAGIEVILIIVSLISKKEKNLNLFGDIVSFFYGLIILWTLFTAKLDILNPALFPPPGRVFWQFTQDINKILDNIQSSVRIILQGYLLALVLAVSLGLILGWSKRTGSAAIYISKFLGAIPPIVYIPYGIALLPTFRSVSVFVIFLASFWPILAGTMSGVQGIEKTIIDSAKVLNVSKSAMFFKVILPAALPQIFIGCNQGLGVSFILLTSAEMIGAQKGLGFYIKQYSDFGDYTRTIVGILVIGIVIVAVSFVFNKLQQYLLRWKQ